MHFEPTETQGLVQRTARDFATRVVAPLAASIDADAKLPGEVLAELARLGLMAISVPPDVGGSGAGTVAYALAIQEIARACASTAVAMSVTNMVGETLARFGAASLAPRHCPRLAGGAHGLGAFALRDRKST